MVKLYADEEGHEAVRRHEVLVVSAIARVEVASALWRKQRAGELAAEACAVLLRAFAADLAGSGGAAGTTLLEVAVSSRVLVDAARLTGSGRLRSYDAVQLASARAARAADPSVVTFACFDRRLGEAAAAEGFAALKR